MQERINKMWNTKELMHCHCGTNNGAPRWTFMDPCKPEVRPGAQEESASPAWLAPPAMNARDTTKVYKWRLDTGCGSTLYRNCHSHNTPGKRHNNTWVEPLAGNCTTSSTQLKEQVRQKCKIQKNWCTDTVAPTIEHYDGHSFSIIRMNNTDSNEIPRHLGLYCPSLFLYHCTRTLPSSHKWQSIVDRNCSSLRNLPTNLYLHFPREYTFRPHLKTCGIQI